MTATPPPKPSTTTSRRADTLTRHALAAERVIASMRQRLDEVLSLRDMAKLAFMSPFHFNRTFRRLTGVPPLQYLSAVRLETAKRLLLTTKMSVTDVCFEVGYQSLGSFTKRFTTLVGLAPRRFRNSRGSEPWLGSASGYGSVGSSLESGTSVTGRVAAPGGFEGIVFVGLFSSPLPQGRPVACAVLSRPGDYKLAGVPDGLYYLMALGLPRNAGLWDFSLFDTALRGGGQALTVARGYVEGLPHLTLRQRDPLDPPILLALPTLAGPAARAPKAPPKPRVAKER